MDPRGARPEGEAGRREPGALTVRAVVGIDGGATGTRALVLDERGARLARAEGPAALLDRPGRPIDGEAVAATAREAAQRARIRLPAAALCAGLAGVGREPERKTAEDELRGRGLASIVRVVTDAEAAFADAFGDGPGLLLIAGTGSMAWGRAESARTARAGGWGALLGDEGSAYAMGVRALRAVARASDGRGPETALLARLLGALGLPSTEELIPWAAQATKAEIAALAPIVCDLRDAGDAVAARIVAAAVAELEAHVRALFQRLGPWSGTPVLALTGGLVGPGGPLREAVIAAVGQYCTPLERPLEPERGAANLALRELGPSH